MANILDDGMRLRKMGRSELLKLAYEIRSHPVRVARGLFGEYRYPGYVRSTLLIAAYAENLAALKLCSEYGDKLGVEVYDLCCESVLRELHVHAKYNITCVIRMLLM